MVLAFGVAEQCSRFRKDGSALFEPFKKTQDRLREFAPPPELANRARNPKGHDRANMVLGPFAVTKGPRAPGRNPDNFKKICPLLKDQLSVAFRFLIYYGFAFGLFQV
ncbi:MAG: hypothetical protein NPIRA03_32100 [Nitrospirales bacterium]|nr:MAG: hypothetical protein NPIRA03_32100 [Nitrospirales bacterium]